VATKKDETIKKIVTALKEEFNPSRLFLFGSQAKGSSNADSDYDFVVVVPKKKHSRLKSMSQARSLLHDKCNISADVFVFSEAEFDEWKTELNSIPETALNTGLELDLG
jgi:predicted nucleotidyltransferase